MIKRKPSGYWTKEMCHKEALRFKSKSEFQFNSKSAYNKSLDKGWLDEICLHMEILGNKFKRCIYVYEFSDNYAYIGLTVVCICSVRLEGLNFHLTTKVV